MSDVNTFFGLYRGVVVDNDDSSTPHPYRGCVQVRIPQAHGPEVIDEELPWAEPCLPFGGGRPQGNSYGMVAIPSIGSTVWIMFEQGELSNPVWVGTWYGEKDAKPEMPDEAVEGYPDTFLIKDPSSSDGMFIRFMRGQSLEIVAAKDKTHVIVYPDGRVSVRSQEGDIAVYSAEGDVSVEAADGQVALVSGSASDDTRQSITMNPDVPITVVRAKRFDIYAEDVNVFSENNIVFRAAEGVYCNAKHSSGFEKHTGS